MKRTGVVLAAVLTVVGLSGCGDKPAYATDDRGVALSPQTLASDSEVYAAYKQLYPNSNYLGGQAGFVEQMKKSCALMIEQDSGDLVLMGILMESDVSGSVPNYIAHAQLWTENYCPNMTGEVAEAIQEGKARVREG
ncbi:hypothetical protein [Kocuria sp. CH-021]|uniref:hypothetical protein n=1 Tax=Kocuria sp. CH-021 TaxID=3406735 RepID=UPI003C795DFC